MQENLKHHELSIRFDKEDEFLQGFSLFSVLILVVNPQIHMYVATEPSGEGIVKHCTKL